MWWPGAPGRHIIYTQPHTTQNFINHKHKFARNSEGTEELSDDGTHVGAER
jgi:hypothetical protein